MGLDIDFNYNRMCKSGGCCDTDRRSDTDFCHDLYSFFGDSMNSACWHCCDEPQIPAPEPEIHPIFPPLDCAAIDNPHRICKDVGDKSCCQPERSSTQYCQDIYKDFGDQIHSICWYCCETSREVGANLDTNESGLLRRLLRVESYQPVNSALNKTNTMEQKNKLLTGHQIIPSKYQPVNSALEKVDTIEQKKKLVSTIETHGSKNTKDTDNNEVTPLKSVDDNTQQSTINDDTDVSSDQMLTDGAYFDLLMERHLLNEDVIRNDEERSRRRLVNYEDVSYWPYEWLVKVKTEYYFRYEGTQAVPPCKDQVHWRVMKDPIPVARRQLAELERLMAERISPDGSRFKECQPDNAGTVRPDTNETLFDFARPTQKFHKLHRKVFCECKDWKSKFPEDRAWCKRNIIDRFYRSPYNFDKGEEFF